MAGIATLEILGFIGALGVASVAGWTANRIYDRAQSMERRIFELRGEIHRLRRDMATAGPPSESPRTTFEPLYQRVAEAPRDRQALPFGRGASTERPDVAAIATQLGMQSPEAIEHLLSGQLSLGAAAREMGTGRQEARLLYWLHGRSDTGMPGV